MRWMTDWEENDAGEWRQVRRNELGATEEDEEAQEEMRREHLEEMLREEYGEDGP
jgi:hypothetical protein